MNRNSGQWIAIAVAMLGLAVISVILGLDLMPTLAGAETKGIATPWYFTWFVILLTAMMAVVLAGFLFATVRRGRPADR